MNTHRILSLEKLNSAARMIIEENQAIKRWKLGETSRMTGDFLDLTQEVTLTGFEPDGTEFFWICDESMIGGEVKVHSDNCGEWRYVEISEDEIWLDTSNGEFIDPSSKLPIEVSA